MNKLSELLERQPIVPYIRESDYAVRNPWHFPERRLLDYLLIYIQEGHCIIHVEGEEYHFGEGEFCLIQPNRIFTLRGATPTITPFAHFDIFYHPLREQSFPTRAGQIDLSAYRHLMQPVLNDLQDVDVPVKLAPEQPVLFRDTMLRMVECWLQRDPIAQYEAQCLASELVLTILKQYAPHRQRGTASSLPSLNWITSYFSFRLSEPLSVASMAERANLSPSRFNAVFKQHFGMPPYQYLMRLRIKHAKELLATTELTLEPIAEYCGFADIYHFSKSFRKMTGMSPGQWRSRVRSEIDKQ